MGLATLMIFNTRYFIKFYFNLREENEVVFKRRELLIFKYMFSCHNRYDFVKQPGQVKNKKMKNLEKLKPLFLTVFQFQKTLITFSCER